MKKFIITGAITLGILGVFGYTSHAKISNQPTNNTTQTQQYCNLGHYNCNLIHANTQHYRNKCHYNNHINNSHHTW